MIINLIYALQRMLFLTSGNISLMSMIYLPMPCNALRSSVEDKVLLSECLFSTLTLSVLFNSEKARLQCAWPRWHWGLCSTGQIWLWDNAISSCWPFGDLLVSCLWTKFDVISPRLWQVQPRLRPIWWCVVSLLCIGFPYTRTQPC